MKEMNGKNKVPVLPAIPIAIHIIVYKTYPPMN